jgi:hypothetical protein
MAERPSFIGVNGHSGFTMQHSDKRGDFRSWCVCECGWVSPDIIGRDGAYMVWRRHVAEQQRGSQPHEETP